MSNEPRPGRMPHRTVARWRQAVSVAVSVAVHVSLALLLLFAVSSDHETGRRDSVPISVLTRGSAGAAAPTVMAGMKTAEPATSATDPSYRQRRQRTKDSATATPARDANPVPTPAAATDQVGDVSGQGLPSNPTAGEPAGAGDDAFALQGAGDSAVPALSGAGTGGSGTAGVQGGAVSPGRSDEEAPVRLEADRVYALLVRKALERHGAYPSTARRLGLEGLVEMLVRIDGSGLLFERRVLTTSGFPQLDEAALASADRLGTLPPPPGGRPIDIRIPVRFSVRRN